MLDSTGIVMHRSQRHFDRGAGEIDRGQFERAGARVRRLGRRRHAIAARMLEDVDDRRRGTSTRTSSPIARTPTSRGGRSCSAGTALYVPAAVAHARAPRDAGAAIGAAGRHQSLLGAQPLPAAPEEPDRGACAALRRCRQPCAISRWSATCCCASGARLPALVDVLRLLPRRWPSGARSCAAACGRRAADRVVPPMKVAILGTRGIPANYGGFETFAQELATRLVARGHDVSVYCRAALRAARRSRPTRACGWCTCRRIRHKYLDTVVHTLRLAGARDVRGGYDVVLVCNAANAIFCAWPRLAGTQVALNVDGIERKRKKWNALGRGWYLVSERLATWLPERHRHRRRGHQGLLPASATTPTSTFIPYGCQVGRDAGRATLDRLRPRARRLLPLCQPPGARKQRARGDRRPSNRPSSSQKLVVVGDAPVCPRIHRDTERGGRPPGGVHRRGLRRRLSRAAVPRAGLRPRHGSRRHAPGAGRGDGLRQLHRWRTTCRRTARCSATRACSSTPVGPIPWRRC